MPPWQLECPIQCGADALAFEQAIEPLQLAVALRIVGT